MSVKSSDHRFAPRIAEPVLSGEDVLLPRQIFCPNGGFHESQVSHQKATPYKKGINANAESISAPAWPSSPHISNCNEFERQSNRLCRSQSRQSGLQNAQDLSDADRVVDANDAIFGAGCPCQRHRLCSGRRQTELALITWAVITRPVLRLRSAPPLAFLLESRRCSKLNWSECSMNNNLCGRAPARESFASAKAA